MKNSYLCLIISLLIPAGLWAQSTPGSLKGIVIDPDGLPVSYATIQLENTQWGSYSDESGTFLFRNMPPGDYSLSVLAPGYITFLEKIAIQAGSITELKIVLSSSSFQMPQVNILSEKSRLLSVLPGSASYITPRELELLAPISGNEVFRRIPGIHVVDEEGAGLRINIGLRGLNPDRSRNVLILEDGVPVALSPYGEPEMYYTPSIDRMAGVEVLKGSGQILFGPQTIGGVVNYLTVDPPQEEKIRVRLQGGQGGYFSGLVSYGNTFGNTGLQVNLLRRQATNLGPTQFEVSDLSAKFKFLLGEKSALGVKIGVYDENSNSTYVGITQAMYDAGGQDYVRLAPNDLLQVRRYSLSTTHEHHFSSRLSLKTTAFGYTTSRDWRRQDFSYDPAASRQTGVVWGDTSIAGGAIYMRNGTGNRNRQFEVAGIEPRLSWNYALGSKKSELQSGVRFLYERAFEQRINGTSATARSGELVEDEIRTGNAFSAFAQNEINLTPKWAVTLGLRLENYRYERDILRRRYSGSLRDTSIVAGNTLTSIIPGVGMNYQLGPKLSVFGGIHRGFAPPRIKDAISNEGEAYQLNAELSWNTELGLRSAWAKGLSAELTGFSMDFSNQIIPVSVSSGGTGAGLVNGGRTYHRGVEASVVLGVGEWLNAPFVLELEGQVTVQEARFKGDRFLNISNEQVNVSGNRTPYSPPFLLSSALTFETNKGLQLRLTGTGVGEQFTDEQNSIIPDANGRTGSLPGYFLLDGTAQYTLAKIKTTFLLSAKNITDARYIANRRPEGIRVGLPRYLSAGMVINL